METDYDEKWKQKQWKLLVRMGQKTEDLRDQIENIKSVVEDIKSVVERKNNNTNINSRGQE